MTSSGIALSPIQSSLVPWRFELDKAILAGPTWRGRGLTREVLSFQSGEIELYGSLYAGAEDRTGPAVVICPPWGAEARQADGLIRPLARGVAEIGGTALVFDWPGQGESGGEPDRVALEDLVTATCDAAATLRTRCDQLRVVLVGLRVGAAVAALATRYVSPDALVLIQPAWDPADHFASVSKASARSGLGKSGSNGWAFGFPLPSQESFANSGGRVMAGLDAYTGSTVEFRYESKDESPSSVERIDVPGDWRHSAAIRDFRLTDAALEWLRARFAG